MLNYYLLLSLGYCFVELLNFLLLLYVTVYSPVRGDVGYSCSFCFPLGRASHKLIRIVHGADD